MKAVLNILMVTGLLIGRHGHAEDESNFHVPRPSQSASAQSQYKTRLKDHHTDQNKLVLPGLLADRETSTVEITVECTGLAEESIIEFLLIDQGSSHGYESMLWSYAKPSDIHRGLEFIGVQPAPPTHPAIPRHWAEGDRVTVLVKQADKDPFPIEQLVYDLEKKQTLPEEGFAFAGSFTVAAEDDEPNRKYVADLFDPRSIISTYNERATVLDIPRELSKSETYGKHVVNPQRVFKHGQMLRLFITPSNTDNTDHPIHLTINRGRDGAEATCSLTNADGTLMLEASDLKSTLEMLVTAQSNGQPPPSVRISFGAHLSVAIAQKAALLLAALEPMNLVRVMAPAPHELYHRAFAPDKSWQQPEGRPTQPWELHLTKTNNTLSVRAVWQEAVWNNNEIDPTFQVHNYPIDNPSALEHHLRNDRATRIKAETSRLPEVLLVFADPGVTYGEMMAFLRPVQLTHGTIYIFVNPAN